MVRLLLARTSARMLSHIEGLLPIEMAMTTEDGRFIGFGFPGSSTARTDELRHREQVVQGLAVGFGQGGRDSDEPMCVEMAAGAAGLPRSPVSARCSRPVRGRGSGPR